MNKNNARTNWIGRPFNEEGARTPVYVQKAINKAINDTSTNTGLTVTIAFDYGSRAELVRSVQHALKSNVPVTPHVISSHLYQPDMPPVDLLIRTSGEARISNFLLWQIKGAKVYFTEHTWPDFTSTELDAALSCLLPTCNP